MQPTERTRVKRSPKRAVYEKQTIYEILDEHFLCHVAVIDGNFPVVIPTLYGRKEDRLYIHGASSSRLLNLLQNGSEICLNVTLVDGFVMARSVFHHSMNYRSVILFGKANLVPDGDEKIKALKIITDHIVPGRWEEVRSPNSKELKATKILSVPIHEASAKIRTGPPADEPEDYLLDVWAGVLPVRIKAEKLTPDPELKKGTAITPSIERLLLKYNGN